MATRVGFLILSVSAALCLQSNAEGLYLPVNKAWFDEEARMVVNLNLRSLAPQSSEPQVVVLTQSGSGRVEFSDSIVTLDEDGTGMSSFVGVAASASKTGTVIEVRAHDPMSPGMGTILASDRITIVDVVITAPSGIDRCSDGSRVIQWQGDLTVELLPPDINVLGILTIDHQSTKVNIPDSIPVPTPGGSHSMPMEDEEGLSLPSGELVAKWLSAEDRATPGLEERRIPHAGLNGIEPDPADELVVVPDNDEYPEWPGFDQPGVLLKSGTSQLIVEDPQAGSTIVLTWSPIGESKMLAIAGNRSGTYTLHSSDVPESGLTLPLETLRDMTPSSPIDLVNPDGWVEGDWLPSDEVAVHMSLESCGETRVDDVMLGISKTVIKRTGSLWWNTEGPDGSADIDVLLRCSVASGAGPFALEVSDLWSEGRVVLLTDPDLSLSAGASSYEWNGKDPDGNPADAGGYGVTASWFVDNIRTFTDTASVRVFRADLEYALFPDEDFPVTSGPNEENPGGFILWNNNDDDGVAGADMDYLLVLDQVDPDLKEMKLWMPGGVPLTGIVTLEIDTIGSTPGSMRLWRNRKKKALPMRWDLSDLDGDRIDFTNILSRAWMAGHNPDNGIWLEGVALGQCELKILFNGIVRDKVRMTIGVQADIAPHEHTSPGMTVAVNDGGDYLVPVTMRMYPAGVDEGQVVLKFESGSDKIKVWSNADAATSGGTPWLDATTTEKRWDLPGDVATFADFETLLSSCVIEGVAPGTAELKLFYKDTSGAEVSRADTLMITAVKVVFQNEAGGDRGLCVSPCDGKSELVSISAFGTLAYLIVSDLTVGDSFGTVKYIELMTVGGTPLRLVPSSASDHNGQHVISTFPEATLHSGNQPELKVWIKNALGRITERVIPLALNEDGTVVMDAIFIPPADATAYSLDSDQKFKLDTFPDDVSGTIKLSKPYIEQGEAPVGPGTAIDKSKLEGLEVTVAVAGTANFGTVPLAEQKHVSFVDVSGGNTTIEATYAGVAKDKITILKVGFIRQDNTLIPQPGTGDDDNACHMVSKFRTDVNLPDTATFDGPPIYVSTPPGPPGPIQGEADPDTFRVQIKGLPSGQSPKIRLEVLRSGSAVYPPHEFTMVHGTVGSVSSYRTDEHIRLVSNAIDDGHLAHQTPLVKIGDIVRATLVLNGSDVCSTELRVTRPSTESGINAKRLVNCRFQVMDHPDVSTYANTSAAATQIQRTWAQAGVTVGMSSWGFNIVTNTVIVEGALTAERWTKINLDGVDTPDFLVGTPGRRDAIHIAEDIAVGINNSPGWSGAYAVSIFDTDERKQAVVVVKNGPQSVRIATYLLPGVFVSAANVRLNDGSVNSIDAISILANYADSDPNTVDIFVVKKIVSGVDMSTTPPTITYANGIAYSPSINGSDADSRNMIFLNIASADATPRPFTGSHEMLHVLADVDDVDDPSALPYYYWNVLAPTDAADSIGATKRISTTQHQATRTVNDGRVLQQSYVP